MDETNHPALREWARLCHGLAQGEIVALVRKGGIHERRGRLFELRYQRFYLFPSFEHQELGRLHPDLRTGTVPQPTEGVHTISHWAQVKGAWQVADQESLRDFANWSGFQGHSEDEVMARWSYREQGWVQIILMQVFALPTPLILPRSARYGGCRSWIDLESGSSEQGLQQAQSVLDPTIIDARLSRCAALFGNSNRAH